LERVRSTLGELAFKRGVRAWVWGDDQRAAAVAGLTSNATRSTSDAAWLALDTHEVLAGLSDDLPSPLSASIAIVRGIASGSRDSFGNLVRFRLHEPADYLSDTVLEATPVGITWVAGGVYRLARREFMWRDVPSIALEEGKRGDLPPSLAVYALDRALSPKEWQAVQETNDLVGRESEKIDLLDACHQAIGKSVVTARALVGEIGIGKTTLVDAFLAEANIARAVRIDCSPSRQDTPFSAVAELVRSLLQLKPEDPFETVAAAIRNAGGMASPQSGPESLHPIVQRLAEMVTERPVGGDEDDPMALRRQILSGLRSLLAALSLQQALVLVIEGLQWADRLSLEVLHELIVQQDPFPVLILLVSREDERVEFVLDGLIRIELRGLSADEQVHLVESRLGITKGVRAVCAEILPKVGGNPFFLLEMVDALLERGSLELREEVVGTKRIKALAKREGVQVVLPTTLEQLLGDRLHELPSEEQRVVDWLAVSGMPLSLVELSILVGESVEVAITRLCARGVAINTDDAIDFRHPLTRDVAYASLSFAERVQMHRALGELLAKGARHKGINAALVARHLMRGEAETQAAPYFFEAAIAARNGNQVALAARYFSRFTQTAMPGDPRLFDAHESLEGIYRLLGRRKDRVKHLEELRTLGKTQKIARFAIVALLRTSRFELDEGHLDTGLAIAKNAADAARLAKAPQYEAEGEALSSEFLRELGRVQEALVACDRALSACDPTNHPNVPPRLRAEVLRSRGVLLRRVGRVREAIAAYVESIAVFRKTDARRSEARAKHVLAFAMLCQGRYEDAVALAVDSIRIDLSIGGRFQLANTLTNIGHAYAKMGDYERAEAYLKRARGIHDSYGDQDGKADTLTVSAEILLEQGRLEEAEPFLRDADLLNEA
ncbi:MAG: tetratricopeptide repeat protein, partial [Polyangiaceae bacterium]|nr:tetratricopeptide repeat protein [Polyangiaceae bacterium]